MKAHCTETLKLGFFIRPQTEKPQKSLTEFMIVVVKHVHSPAMVETRMRSGSVQEQISESRIYFVHFFLRNDLFNIAANFFLDFLRRVIDSGRYNVER